MWVLLGIFLNRLWRATVGVTFPQDRVHGTALHDIVFSLNGLFVVGLRIIWIVGKQVAFLLQFGNGGLELRDGRGNVWKLDHVSARHLHQFAQLGQVGVLSARVGYEVGQPHPAHHAAAVGDGAASQHPATLVAVAL